MDAFHDISLFQSPTKANPPLGASQHSLPDNYALLPAGALHDSNRYVFLYQQVTATSILPTCIYIYTLTLIERNNLTGDEAL